MPDSITNQLSSFQIITPLNREHFAFINDHLLAGENHVKITRENKATFAPLSTFFTGEARRYPAAVNTP